MKARPLHDRVVVKRQIETNMTPGGLHIPASAKEKPAEGEVLAVGSGRILPDGTTRQLDVKVGDRVLSASTAAPK